MPAFWGRHSSVRRIVTETGRKGGSAERRETAQCVSILEIEFPFGIVRDDPNGANSDSINKYWNYKPLDYRRLSGKVVEDAGGERE
jgi:hypothetical protein